MDRWQNRVAVVTGASSGIGAAIVKDLLQGGMVVVGMARRTERIDDLRRSLPLEQQPRLHSVHCDLMDSRSVDKAFDWVVQKLAGVDILVNNAGVMAAGPIFTQDIGRMRAVLETNVTALLHCSQRAFRSMRQRHFDGHIVHVNSVVGHSVYNPPPGVLPEFNVYTASKHAVTAITELMRQELHGLGTKIKVTSISPGLVDTDIVPDSFKSMVMLRPEDISQGILYAISTAPLVQVHELTIKPIGETF